MNLLQKQKLVDYYSSVMQSYNVVEKYVENFDFSPDIASDIKVTISEDGKEVPLFFTSAAILDNGTKIKRQASHSNYSKFIELEFNEYNRKFKLLFSPDIIALSKIEFSESFQGDNESELISLSTIANCFRTEEERLKRLDINTFPDTELSLPKASGMIHYNTRVSPTTADNIKCYLGNALTAYHVSDTESFLNILDSAKTVLQQSFNSAITYWLDNKTGVMDGVNIFPHLEPSSYESDKIEIENSKHLPDKSR